MKRAGWILAFLAGPLTAGCDACTEDPPPAPSQRRNPPPRLLALDAFSEAVTLVGSESRHTPPERTSSGLLTVGLRRGVERMWNDIDFTSPAGNLVSYDAVLDTNYGVIVVELRPDLAPNHVRNFIALARAGFYHGLEFERVGRATPSGTAISRIELGCPFGLSESVPGHLGYCLKSEISPGETHLAGTVGTCRDEGPDTAGCRFYITLGRSPEMDGMTTVFGRVVLGLDTARTIGGELRKDRPRPVIRTMTIQAREVDSRTDH